jgi:hypothetical protein
MKELIRQVSLECLERGLLFEKIWNSYTTLMEKAVTEMNREKIQEEQVNLTDISRVHKMYK